MSKQKTKPKSSKSNFTLLITLITTIIVLILSIAKYTNTFADEDNTYIATPILNFETSDTLDVSIKPTDEEKKYYFGVANYTEEKTSEVTIEYYIKINSLANLPLEFELYTYENEEIGTDNLLDGNGQTIDVLELKPDEEKIDYYVLVINWGEDANYQYAGEIDYVQIVLYGEQVD